MGLSIPIGTIVSFALSGVIFRDPNNLIAELKLLILIQNIWITVFGGLFFFVIRDRPVEAPSFVSTQEAPKRKFIDAFMEAF